MCFCVKADALPLVLCTEDSPEPRLGPSPWPPLLLPRPLLTRSAPADKIQSPTKLLLLFNLFELKDFFLFLLFLFVQNERAPNFPQICASFPECPVTIYINTIKSCIGHPKAWISTLLKQCEIILTENKTKGS